MGGGFGPALDAERRQIGRSLGKAGSFGGGLGPPPGWVRRWRRVLTWVWTKLLINGVGILRKHGLMAEMQHDVGTTRLARSQSNPFYRRIS
jgi:hypothetical protein